MCGVQPLFDELKLLKGCDIDSFDLPTDYDLGDILTNYSCPAAEDSETSCKKLVESFMNTSRGFTVEAKKAVAVFRELPQSIYSNREVPDVVVYDKAGNIILTIEVHSCVKKMSFNNIIKKTVLELIDIIRYYKGICSDITKCTGYTFPKFERKLCVVEVVVEFKNFMFVYELKCISLNDVKKNMLTAINGNQQRFEACFGKTVPKHVHFVKLSESELHTFRHFCNTTNLDASVMSQDMDIHVEQYASKEALLISCNERMWKFPSRRKDAERLNNPPQGDYVVPLKRWISVRRDEQFFTGKGWFHYPKVKHFPMVPSEAKACIADFVSELCGVLVKLHDSYYVHLDVRLENICFNDSYRLILVDLDRCCYIDDVSRGDTMGSSIMYQDCKEEKIDWKQVGCMLLWIYGWENQIQHQNNYHTQDITLVHDPITNDEFVLALMKGTNCLVFSCSYN